MSLAIFGISNSGLNLAVTLLILMFVVVWLALIVYTYLDAKRRISDPFLVACATIASFFPYIGTAVYAIVRPPEFLEDAQERELEIKAAELRVRQLNASLVPELRVPDREGLPALPQLPAPAQGPVPELRQAGRPALGALPLLRDRPAGAGAAATQSGGPQGHLATRGATGAQTAAGRPQESARVREERAGQRAASKEAPPTHQTDRKGAPAVSRTLILVKPDAFERALTGEVIARFERKGLRIAALKTMRADEAIANEHYAEHTEKPFFGELVSFITGGPLVAMVLEGHEAVAAARQLIGATNPVEAAPGSIRGDFALEVTFNMVHGSDSDESAEREIGIWFPELS